MGNFKGTTGTAMSSVVKVKRKPWPQKNTETCPVCFSVAGEPCRNVGKGRKGYLPKTHATLQGKKQAPKQPKKRTAAERNTVPCTVCGAGAGERCRENIPGHGWAPIAKIHQRTKA